jgi:phage gp46-like protein
MDFAIAIDGSQGSMTFEPVETILNNIYLSLMVERGSLFVNPEFGSRLHLLKRAKNTVNKESLAREYCREALKWLLDTGRAMDIQVESERDRKQDLNRLKLRVIVTQSNGRTVTFERFVEVV